MEVHEAGRIVFSRIQRLEPENVSKIMGYLLLQDNGFHEMIRLAFGPDTFLLSFICQAKKDLGLLLSPSSSCIFNSTQNLGFQISGGIGSDSGPHPLLYWPERPAPSPFTHDYLNCAANSHSRIGPLLGRASLHDYGLNAETSASRNKFARADIHSSNGGGECFSLRQSNSSAALLKPCLYFGRGFCKHGNKCRFLHELSSPNNAATDLGPILSDNSSLERLELELEELLRGKKTPVSIASLPQLYYEKYGKTLQAEGYLTESQRHGKAGYSLTKLLARLNSTLTLIERPHGQHAVVLAEEAKKYSSHGSGLLVGEHGGAGADTNSRQIYLTFPAESTFTEEDVSNYFRNFGPVDDVRIPHQQKRMFGFVTFVFPETVRRVLSKGNPHFVCGARVLAKPYKDKGKLAERKNSERGEPFKQAVAMTDFDLKNYEHQRVLQFPGPPFLNNGSEIMKRHCKDNEQALELERQRLSSLCIGNSRVLPHLNFLSHISAPKGSDAVPEQHCTSGLVFEGDSKASEDLNAFITNDHFRRLIDLLESEEDAENYNDEKGRESDGDKAPESPFSGFTELNSGKSSPRQQYSSDSVIGSRSPPLAVPLDQTLTTVGVIKERTCSMWVFLDYRI